MDVKQEIEQLRAALNEAGYEYYVLDRPTMSDYDYDHRLRRLEELEKAYPEYITPDSPTQRERRSPDLKRSATVFRWKVFRMCFPWKNSPTSTSASMRALGMWSIRWSPK